VREAFEKQNKETTNCYECNKQIEKKNVKKSFDTCRPSVITRNRQIVTTTPETEGDRKRYGHGDCTKPDKSVQQKKETASEKEKEEKCGSVEKCMRISRMNMV
jgi:hypothetical protein